MDFSALLFCLFFLVVGVMTIGAIKRGYLLKSPVDYQRLHQQQSLMEVRRIQRERTRSRFKLDDVHFAAATPLDASHRDATPTLEVADAPESFNVTRVDEAFDKFLRGRS